MPFILLLIAALFLVSAFQNTQADLATALEQDGPGYLKWAAALGAIGALGWVPGMQKPSRYLLALVLLVIFLRNYSNILQGFQAAAGGATPTASQPTPAADYITSGGGAVPVTSIDPVSTVSTTPITTIPTSLTTTPAGMITTLATGGSSATSGYEMTSTGALVPVEATGNVNAYGTNSLTTTSLPFGTFSPTMFGGTALDSGFGGSATESIA